MILCRWIICGVDKTGQVVIYNRAKLFEPKNLSEAEEDGAGLGGQELPVQPQHLASRGHRGQGGSLSAPGSGQRGALWRPGRSSYNTVLSNVVLLCPVFAITIVMTRQNTSNCTCANG